MTLSFFVMIVNEADLWSEIVRSANGKADSKDYPLGFFFNVS